MIGAFGGDIILSDLPADPVHAFGDRGTIEIIPAVRARLHISRMVSSNFARS
jgi:hypothetical protein